MSAEFDPYSAWLKIRAPQRPLDHYALLGLPKFSQDSAAISRRYQARLTLVRKYQKGKRGERATQLLNELSDAYECLQQPERRAAYDAVLRSSLPTDSPEPPPVARPGADAVEAMIEPPPVIEPPVADGGSDFSSGVSRATAGRRGRRIVFNQPRQSERANRQFVAICLAVLVLVGSPLAGAIVWQRWLQREPRDATADKGDPSSAVAAVAGADHAPADGEQNPSPANAETDPVLDDANATTSAGGNATEVLPVPPPLDDSAETAAATGSSPAASSNPPATAPTNSGNPSAGDDLYEGIVAAAAGEFGPQPAAADAGNSAALPPGARKWNGKGGYFSLVATYVAYEGGVVSLRKVNGEEEEIAIATLSDEDQAWVRDRVRRDTLAKINLILSDARRQMLAGEYRGAQARLLPGRGLSSGDLREDIRIEAMLGLLATLAFHDTAGATGHFRTCLQRAPGNVATLNNLAILKARAREFPAAMEYWSDATQIAPTSPTLRHNLQRFVRFAGTGRLNVARTDLDTARELLDSFPPAATAVGQFGWRFMEVGSDAAGNLTSLSPPAVGRLQLDDRSCLVCDGHGTTDCPVPECQNGVIPGGAPQLGFNPLTRQPFMFPPGPPMRCLACNGRGTMVCPYCKDGVTND